MPPWPCHSWHHSQVYTLAWYLYAVNTHIRHFQFSAGALVSSHRRYNLYKVTTGSGCVWSSWFEIDCCGCDHHQMSS
jgi:hypothetical protein